MKVTQIAAIVNEALDQAIGEHDVLEQDLSNLVEVGKSVMNPDSMDNFVRQLPDVLGRLYFTNTKYEGLNLSIMKEAWEYGAAYARITAEMPMAVVNEVWELQDNTSYDPNVFHKPTVSAKYWQDRNTFDIEISIAKDQAKSAFQNADQLNGLISSIYLEVENAITVALDNLCLLTFDKLIGLTVNDEFASAKYGDNSGIRAVNLLYKYNEEHPGATLTTKTCLNNEKFLEYACEVISNYTKKLTTISTLFNIGGTKKFTPNDKLNITMLDQFSKKADIYLKSSRFHDELVSFPGHRTVPYWQGCGTDYSFDSCSKINVKLDDSKEVELDGILCTMFDDRAAMVCCERRETDVNYNGKARFYNYFYHVFNGLLLDTNFNSVVFFIADPTADPAE